MRRWLGGESLSRRRLAMACGTWALLVACQATQPAPAADPAPKPAPAAVDASANSDASAKHQRAVALSNEADAAVKVNVEGAIAKYLEALQVEPGNVDVLWKLSRAQTKKEDWAAVASTLEQAVKAAPNVANYQHWRGHALVMLAQESAPPQRPGFYESAREPLTRCLKLDAKLAECAFLLAQVEEQAEHVQAAADLYLQAIANEPLQPRYYLALAQWLRVFKQSLQAEMVLTEGLQKVEPFEKNRADLAQMAVQAAGLAGERHDTKAQLAWLEKAETLASEDTPVLAFELGSRYLVLPETGAVPSNQEKAQRLLNVFTKRVCRGVAANKYRTQCEITSSLLERLSSPYVKPTPPKKPLPVVPLPSGMPQPKLALRGVRVSGSFTVWGAAYYLRNPHHQREVTLQPVTIEGYVTKTNLPAAPRCAVHRAGEADPENCRAEIPAFWLGDYPDAPEADCIKVMGFASNYAQLFEAIRRADSEKPDAPYEDAFWGQVIPNPLPAVGAKLRVRGNYGFAFAKASSGAEADAVMGLLDYVGRDILQHAPELATLPGVKRAKPAPVKYEIIPAGSPFRHPPQL
jgi:tetratricopeptide (TPR) repeat protein